MVATSAGAEQTRTGVIPAPDPAGPPVAGATHGVGAAAVAGLSPAERPGRGCGRDIPPPPR